MSTKQTKEFIERDGYNIHIYYELNERDTSGKSPLYVEVENDNNESIKIKVKNVSEYPVKFNKFGLG